MNEEITEYAVEEVSEHDIMELFEELSFREKWRKVARGLRMPPHTGEYKWARLQVTRLWSPVAGLVVPVVLLALLTLLATGGRRVIRKYRFVMKDPDPPIETLKPPPPLDNDKPPPTDGPEVEIYRDFSDHDVVAEDSQPDAQDRFAPVPAPFEAVARIESPVIMVGIYTGRDPGEQGKALTEHGAPKGTCGAIMRALRWLKKSQNNDGSWDACKPAMTGLGLLTFLAHGDTPASAEFGLTVEYAIRWLVENQEADGRFRGRDKHDYSQPIAAYALAEAYGLTRVPMVKEAAEKAVNVIVKGQNPNGGFNYNLVPGGTPKRDDTSYMGWCVQALKAAYLAGLSCDGLDEAMRKAVGGLKKNYGGTYDKGGFGYTGPSSSHGLTSVGALSMQLLGQGNSREVQSAMTAMENAGFWGQGSYSKLYYSYYLTQAKFQAGKQTWRRWNKIFAPCLIERQIVEKAAVEGTDGRLKDIGHWAPGREVSGHTDSDGRVMNTCLAALQLQVYYRYLPTFKLQDIVQLENIAEEKDKHVDIVIDGA